MVSWTRIAGSRCVRAVGIEGTGGDGGDGPVRIHVKFRRGKTYVYNVGNRSYFDQFISAASKGRFYVFVIKARFDYIEKY